MPSSVIAWACLFCIASAAAILLHHLLASPPLNRATKLRLAFGLGLLPTLAALTSTAEGMRVSTEREFCGSCHVMELHVQDSEDPHSTSLAARHARGAFFGEQNCYVCHANYGMYGYALTKLNGMQHVWSYYMDGYVDESAATALSRLHLYQPYSNANCRQCHSTTTPRWRAVGDHTSLEQRLMSDEVSCASAGCHGVAHPFSKPAAERGLPPAFAGRAREGAP